MAHELGAHAVTETPSGAHEHHTPAPADSRRPADDHAPVSNCQSAGACAGVVLAPGVTVEAIDFPRSDRVVQVSAVEPPSEFPDLEPPHPKA